MKIIKYLGILLLLILLGAGAYIFLSPSEKIADLGIKTISKFDANEAGSDADNLERVENGPVVEVVAKDLEIPWEIVILPDARLLVTERPGRVLIIGEEQEVIEIENVTQIGEGGLLGAVIHPDFENNKYIYLYYTTGQADNLTNRVVRYVLDGNELTEDREIISGIGGASYHDGGRMAFGPDGYLYITTGDAGNVDSAQETDSLLGKILRLDEDGNIPEDNPFGNGVYSYGHRNPQGLAWDDQGRLWSTEHGPSGSDTGQDELNLIEIGQNYGWPLFTGDASEEGFIPPVIQSGKNVTWAPAGAVFYEGNIYFTGLRGNGLYEYEIETGDLNKYLDGVYGRLRALTLGPDGYLYISTSNRDGRGEVRDGDDKILKVNIDLLD
jgi:glucose/arabinose dehydrogenase